MKFENPIFTAKRESFRKFQVFQVFSSNKHPKYNNINVLKFV